jgi:hypothetical protein
MSTASRYIGAPGEGQPLNWKSAMKHPDGWIPGFQEQIRWVPREAADRSSAIHLTDDTGRPLSHQEAIDLSLKIHAKQQALGDRRQRKERKGEQRAVARQQLKERQQAEARSSRHSTIKVGLVFWVFSLVAGIAGNAGVGFVAIWIVLSPVWIFTMGVIGRMFLAAMRW